MLGAAQLEILDGWCGDDGAARRAACAVSWDDVTLARAALERVEGLAGARERELDLLEFEIDEIERVDPAPGEDGELRAERERLRNVEALQRAAWGAEQALAEEEAGGAARARRRGREPRVGGGVDPLLAALAERARSLAIEAQDLAAEIRGYGESLEAAPNRLDAVEERLGAIARLERKHGGSIDAVLAHAACLPRAARRARRRRGRDGERARRARGGAARAREGGRGADRGARRGGARARERGGRAARDSRDGRGRLRGDARRMRPGARRRGARAVRARAQPGRPGGAAA